jgi:hypothetical protein
MRTNLIAAFVVAAAALVPAVASADAADSLVGRYDVTFEQVTSNCQAGGLTLARATMTVSKKAPGVTVEVGKVATMGGKVAKAGRLKAASTLAKPSGGQDGKFSIAGTVDDTGRLDAVFVAEFYADGKPVCTQSWSVAGTRAAATATPTAATATPTAAMPAMPAMDAASPATATFPRFILPAMN